MAGVRAIRNMELDHIPAPVVRTGAWPSFSDVVRVRVSVQRRVPRGARKQYSDALTKMLRGTIKSNMDSQDEYYAALRYMMFTRCVLLDKGRGSRRRKPGERANLVFLHR